MCLKINPAIHGRGRLRPIETTRDLVVLKRLVQRKGKFIAPFMGTHYKLGCVMHAPSFVISSRKVYQGLHSSRFAPVLLAQKAAPTQWCDYVSYAFPAVIPAGSRIYLGCANDIVSTQLIVYEDMETMLKALGVKQLAPGLSMHNPLHVPEYGKLSTLNT